MLSKKILVIIFMCFGVLGFSQKKEVKKASMVTSALYLGEVAPLGSKKLIPVNSKKGEVNPKKAGANKAIPGKGFPKGKDELLVLGRKKTKIQRKAKAPSITFETGVTNSDPSDPTGAIGPNHYVSALNSSFAIHDRNGNVLVPSNSLANIWEGETTGDPIVFYDNFADRFIITQFDGSSIITSPDYVDNGFLIAVSKGPDPVNDGWFRYRFKTGNSFPDYPKFSVWSDGYYITTNKDQSKQDEEEVIYVLERDRMLTGNPNARMIGFPLPGSKVNGFYSPASFNAIGGTLPPKGDAKIVYLQDDAWEGVSEDALKLWTVNVNWIRPEQSTITEAEELTVSSGAITAFDSLFDGGSFVNLPQPGGVSIDAQQAVMMHATNYRRFCNYNAVVLNFAVDIDPIEDNVSAIRWYELRQNGDGQPWTVFQEGTYASPDGKSAWCASMGMDILGNIGMGYTTMGTIADGATEDSFVSIRYTGRLVDDPLGTMTFSEETIVLGTGNNDSQRYGDYAHLTIDPLDDATFWHIAEYFEGSSGDARNIVGVFKIAEDEINDVGVIRINKPTNKIFTNAEEIEVTIQNYGTSVQNNIPITYSIDGGAPVNEIVSGPLNPGETLSYTFTTTADVASETEFFLTVETNLATDAVPENDCVTAEILGLYQNDVGVIDLVSPVTGVGLSSSEPIVILIQNFGGAQQSNIPVFYRLDNGVTINEIFTGTIDPGDAIEYTFNTTADLLEFRIYNFQIGTVLENDENTENDTILREIEHQSCFPTSNCIVGIDSFTLSNITNTNIPCTTGYQDFTNLVINLEGPVGLYDITIQSKSASNFAGQMSLWIDFNDNGRFEDSERLLSNAVLKKGVANQQFVFALGNNATTGTHLLRVRSGDVNDNTEDDLNDSCKSLEFGTTHDYTVNISNDQPEVFDLIVVNQPNKQFLITMGDPDAEERLKLNIFTITGQIIVSNFVEKNANGRFVYELDMSYASTGIYFARLGEKNSKNKSAKFIVK